MVSPVWITWTSAYTKEVTTVAHELRGKFDTNVQLRTKCGKRVAGNSAAVADANTPRCKTCAP